MDIYGSGSKGTIYSSYSIDLKLLSLVNMVNAEISKRGNYYVLKFRLNSGY